MKYNIESEASAKVGYFIIGIFIILLLTLVFVKFIV